ncbi:MAG: hypothetical protein PHP62_03090 [Candidatus Moranbacteria bacterium]|nr:hypothetical protein [Candidatus Moranbacteria bacterium]
MENAPYTPYCDAGDEPINIFLNAENTKIIQQEDFAAEDFPSASKKECDESYWLEGKEWRGILIVILVTGMLLTAFFSV